MRKRCTELQDFCCVIGSNPHWSKSERKYQKFYLDHRAIAIFMWKRCTEFQNFSCVMVQIHTDPNQKKPLKNAEKFYLTIQKGF